MTSVMTRPSWIASIAAVAILAGSSFALAQDSPGTNSAGTAQSSGGSPSAANNSQPGVTTGLGKAGTGTDTTLDPQTNGDAAINSEDKAIDKKLKSICRGC